MSDHDELIPKKSKAQQKRDAEAAQALGARLVALPATQLKTLSEKIDLPGDLLDALLMCQSIKAREGHRRQLQYIGKLMRDIDLAPIEQQLAQLNRGGLAETQQLHRIERWRDRLLTEGDAAINELSQHYPETDARQVRQLVTRAHKESAHNQPPRAARLLFKYLRSLLGE